MHKSLRHPLNLKTIRFCWSDQNILKVGLLMSLTIDQGGIDDFCPFDDKSALPMNPLMRICPTAAIDCRWCNACVRINTINYPLSECFALTPPMSVTSFLYMWFCPLVKWSVVCVYLYGSYPSHTICITYGTYMRERVKHGSARGADYIIAHLDFPGLCIHLFCKI